MKKDDDKEVIKSALKDGIKEWMDEKFMRFGKWTVGALAAAIFSAMIYFMLLSQGWYKK
ncbi:fmrfamide related peptide family [Caudoviricetes sp.]|nr:fmrfamide related peptide family [Caudoviricetes sp.]